MKKKRISKLTIYTVLIILCVFTSIIFSNLIALLDEGNLDNANFVDDFGSNMNKDKENEKIEKNHDLSSLISPRDSAYYQTFGHSDDLMFSVDGAGEFTNTSVKDVFETDGSYYVTGHCINTSDNLRSLFLLQIDKTTGNTQNETYWRNSSSWTSPTGGLTVAVNEENNEAFVGGYLGYWSKGFPSVRFETFGIGVIICYDLINWEIKWNKTVGNSLGYEFRDESASKYDFGGERIEDLSILPDGDIVITGTYYSYDSSIERYGVSIFAARLYRINGNEEWLYNPKSIGPDIDNPNPTLGKKILYRSGENDLFILGVKRKYKTTTNNYAFDYFITRLDLLGNVDTEIGMKDIVSNSHYPDPSQNSYEKVFDVVLSNDKDYIYACGVDHDQLDPSYPFKRSVAFWELDIANDCSVTGKNLANFPQNNHSAMFIGVDENDTIYMAGLNYGGQDETQRKVWIANYDHDNETQIFEVNHPSSSTWISNLEVSSLAGDLKDNLTLFAKFKSDSTHGSIAYVFEPNTPSDSATLTPLSSNTVNAITLEWAETPNHFRYFYLFRNNSEISDPQNPNLVDFSLVAMCENYSYIDLSATEDEQLYYYALVCGNDYTNSTDVQYTSTTFLNDLVAPDPYLDGYYKNPNIILKDMTVNLTWDIIYNAEIHIYRRGSDFTSSDTLSMTPIDILPEGTTEFQESADKVGKFYYMVQANDSERGTADNGETIEVDIQDLAKSPNSITVTSTQEQAIDGIVEITWTAFPGTTYYVYGKKDQTFSLSDLSEDLYLGQKTETDTFGRTTITVPSSGNWSICLFATNSSGDATSLSEFEDIKIGLVPQQPEITLLSEAISTDSIIELSWEEVPEADGYLLYRVSGERDGVYVDLQSGNERELIYNGTNKEYIDSTPKKSYMQYFYTVLAYNENGLREFDTQESSYVQVKVVLEDSGFSGQMIGLIVGISIVVALGIGWYFYKKRKPWAAL